MALVVVAGLWGVVQVVHWTQQGSDLAMRQPGTFAATPFVHGTDG